MTKDMNYYKKVTKRLIVFISTLLILYIAFKLSIFYIPFLIAFIISLLIEPVIRKIMKISNLTRKTSAIVTLVIVFSIIIGLLIWGIIGLITEANNVLENFNSIVSDVGNKLTYLTEKIKLENIKIPEQIKEMANGTFNNLLEESSNIAQNVLRKLVDTFRNVPQIVIYIGITILATFFVCTDKIYIIDQVEHHIPKDLVNKVSKKVRKVISSLGDYLKAQSILILISFIIVIIGLLIFKLIGFNVQYPIIMAIIIGFVDALPILGSGSIIIPWAVISAFNGDIKLAVALIILYAIVIVTRQLIEPRIIGKQIGVHPIFTLISMYTGFKLIGITGMFIGPIVLIILKDVFENMIDNGVVKTILDRN